MSVKRSVLLLAYDASDEERLFWFRNIMAGMPFEKGQDSLDYSLQLAYGIQNFYRENGEEGEGVLKPDGSPMAEVNRSGKTSEDFLQEVQEALDNYYSFDNPED